MGASYCSESREAASPTRIEAIWAPFEREDTLGDLADHVVSEEYPKRKWRDEWWNGSKHESGNIDGYYSGMCWLFKDAVTGLVISKGYSKIKRTDIWLHAMLQGLVRKIKVEN